MPLEFWPFYLPSSQLQSLKSEFMFNMLNIGENSLDTKIRL